MVRKYFYWDSFIKLNSERLRDYGQIPYHKVIWYANYHKVQDIESFERLIRSMDSVYLEENKPKESKPNVNTKAG